MACQISFPPFPIYVLCERVHALLKPSNRFPFHHYPSFAKVLVVVPETATILFQFSSFSQFPTVYSLLQFLPLSTYLRLCRVFFARAPFRASSGFIQVEISFHCRADLKSPSFLSFHYDPLPGTFFSPIRPLLPSLFVARLISK